MSQPSESQKQLGEYYLLGRSGMRVSPFCLGTMTFGEDWGWGNSEADARAIFDRYVDAGGNFLDTADMYTGGASEEMVGRFMKDGGNRDSLVIATKFTFNTNPADPNAGGNGRKHIMDSVEASLKRLQTDYIDLYWMHAWDTITPIEEVMSTLHTLVEQGKIRYIGLSDVPAWYLTRAQSLAEWRGWERICALQLEYSLIERNIEREHIPAAKEFGVGVCPWSPLASGLLSGKYKRPDEAELPEGRLTTTQGSGNPVFEKFTEENFQIVDVLLEIAAEIDRHPAQVALNWITKRPGVVSTLIGATKMSQLESNLDALSFEIPAELSEALEIVSRPELVHPYIFYGDALQRAVHGENPVLRQPPWY